MSKFTDKEGLQQEVKVDMSHYRAAAEKGVSLRQLINADFPTSLEKTDTFTQLCASEGLFFAGNTKTGVKIPTLNTVFESSAFDAAGAVTSNVSPPGSRYLFPAAVLEYVENKLQVDRVGDVNAFNSLLAMDYTVANNRIDQPIIDYSTPGGPEAAASQPRGQLALPASMISITASERGYKIPNEAIGMEISDEALKSTTLDLVGMAITRQAEVQQKRVVDAWMAEMLNGNADDAYNVALSSVTAQSYDALVTVAGTLTQKAWVKYLYDGITSRRVDTVMCNLDTALAIEARTGKPVITGDDPNSDRIDAKFAITFPQLVTKVNMHINPLIPANTIVGIDTRYAMARVTNSQASVSDVEKFVMRQGTGLLFQRGQMVYKPFGNEPFHVMTLTVA
jgi:hypothetical protein